MLVWLINSAYVRILFPARCALEKLLGFVQIVDKKTISSLSTKERRLVMEPTTLPREEGCKVDTPLIFFVGGAPLARSNFSGRIRIRLGSETSFECWWPRRSHFCARET